MKHNIQPVIIYVVVCSVAAVISSCGHGSLGGLTAVHVRPNAFVMTEAHR